MSIMQNTGIEHNLKDKIMMIIYNSLAYSEELNSANSTIKISMTAYLARNY